MEEKELKTSVGQRIAIGVIAFLMLGSIVASYAAIIVGNSSSSSSNSGLSDERMKYYEENYAEKLAAFKEASSGEFSTFSPYISEVKAYNEASANEGDVVSKRDLITGAGRELEVKDIDYLAFYVGWCADETIFDSSFDSSTNPTAFATALDLTFFSEVYGSDLIEGWYQGLYGMKLGGIREITIPGKLAYGDSQEVCGGYNKPLKFMIMAVANEGELSTAMNDLNLANLMLQYAEYGIDYEKDMASQLSE